MIAFMIFKKEIHELYHEDLNSSLRTSNKQLNIIKNNPETFMETYTNSICEALKDTFELLDYKKIDCLISSLLSQKSAIFAFNQSINYAKEIQKDFLLKNKIIMVGETADKQKEIAGNLDNNSVALILSNYGNYFKDHNEIVDILINNNVKMILVTLSYSSPLLVNFDEIITLSSKRFTDVGGYPLKLFTEYLVRRLMVL